MRTRLLYGLVLSLAMMLGMAACGGERAQSSNIPVTGVWKAVYAFGAIPKRTSESMAFVADHNRLLVFGGLGLGLECLGDTWSFEPNTGRWTEAAPSGETPAARFGHSLVYASGSDEVLLFGGQDHGTHFNDTWLYECATNRWWRVEAGPRPPARVGHSMVFDEKRDRVVLFGGWDGSAPLADMWAFDLATSSWTNLRPERDVPPARAGLCMVYDSARDKIILFGGEGSGHLHDTWVYDPETNLWSDLTTDGNRPEPRSAHAMAYDPAADRVILFGGNGSGFFNDTWVHDPGASVWTKASPGGDIPPAVSVSGYSMAYNPRQKRMLLAGDGGFGEGFSVWAYAIGP